MPGFSNRIAALRELTSELDTFTSKVSDSMAAALSATESGGDQIARRIETLQEDVNPRLEDLKRTLEESVASGNDWSKGLLDLIRQVEQGTLRADQIFNKFGEGVVNFEGKLQHVDDLLLQFLPTSGQVQESIEDLRKALEGADIGSLVEHLREQYNAYALALADAVDAFREGKGSLERIAQLAQQIDDRLPNSETDALADAIREKLLGGLL